LPYHIHTPLLTSAAFGSAQFDDVLLKMDALQPSGSFKLRGVGAWFDHAVQTGATGVICPSGGNAGFAAAYCGCASGIAVTIVVPETTSAEARSAIVAAGADVTIVAGAFDEASAKARALADERGWAYLHPFDDPLLWQGHSTLIDEVVATGEPFDCVVTSVGGGGLLLGILEGLKRNGLGHIPVIAVETEGAASLHASLDAGRLVTLPAILSVATSLGAKRVAERAFALAQRSNVISLAVSDAQAVAACVKFANTARVMVEPACGAALAALDVHGERLKAYRRPLVEVCGGIGVSVQKLSDWERSLAG
jgi:L-serine/L-threonine ammonia-lyase